MWRGSLRNPLAPAASRWDWGWLSECFGTTRISLSDVDACLYAVERRGHILWIEIKRDGQLVSYGQQEMLRSFSTKPQCAALILWGEQDAPTAAQWLSHGVVCDPVPADRESVAGWIADWFRRASL